MTPSTAAKLQEMIQEAIDSHIDLDNVDIGIGSIRGDRVTFKIEITDDEARGILGEDSENDDDEDHEEEELEDVEGPEG